MAVQPSFENHSKVILKAYISGVLYSCVCGESVNPFNNLRIFCPQIHHKPQVCLHVI